MKAEILAIGSEIVNGDIIDTNSQYMARKLTANGINVDFISALADNINNMVSSIDRALSRSEVIITTGGLGPTEDDLTRKAIAEVTGRKLYQKPELVEELENYFKAHNYKITGNNYRQTYIPQGAKVIANHQGTAPGFLLKYRDKIIIALPGVPWEMKEMFTETVIPYLQDSNDNIIISETLHFFGIGESTLETRLLPLFNKLDANTTVSLLAEKGEVKARITSDGNKREDIEKSIKNTEEMIRKKVGKYIYGKNNTSLPEIVGNLLNKTGCTVSLAESCTGGLLGNRITDIPGSSNYFMGGLIVYSNQAKTQLLNINKETLEEYGAVSKETAREMSRNVRKEFSTDIGIGITGIAGPGGGTREKPVGLVYIGLSYKEDTEVFKLNLNYSRQRNKWMSSQYALFYLYNFLKNDRGQNK